MSIIGLFLLPVMPLIQLFFNLLNPGQLFGIPL